MKPARVGRRQLLTGGLAVAVAVVVEACGGDDGAATSSAPSTTAGPAATTAPGSTVPATTAPAPTTAAAPTSTLAPIETAQAVQSIAAAADGIPELSMMSTALKTAGEVGVDTLSGLGPVTVFAPTNDALVASIQQLNALGKLPLPRAEAIALANYLVIDGRRTAADLLALDGQEVATRHGSTVKITVSGSTVQVNGVPITTPDIDAGGNILHVVEQAILPPELTGGPSTTAPANGTIADVIAGQEDLAVFTDGAKTFGVFDVLMAPSPLMVFVPTNDAFIARAEELGQAGVPTSGTDANSILMGHVAYDVRSVADLAKMDGQSIPSLNSGTLAITVSGADVMVNGAKIVRGDLQGSNGVVHVIDHVVATPQA